MEQQYQAALHCSKLPSLIPILIIKIAYELWGGCFFDLMKYPDFFFIYTIVINKTCCLLSFITHYTVFLL